MIWDNYANTTRLLILVFICILISPSPATLMRKMRRGEVGIKKREGVEKGRMGEEGDKGINEVE